jgi:hypothetical protein
MLKVGSDPQVPTFRNSTYLDPQVGLTRDLGALHVVLKMDKDALKSWVQEKESRPIGHPYWQVKIGLESFAF